MQTQTLIWSLGVAVFSLVVDPATGTAQQEPACRILGRVVAAESGEGLAGVTIWAQRGDGAFLGGTVTSADGAYAIGVSCDAEEMAVRAVGYHSVLVGLAFGSGELLQRTVVLQRAPLEVEELVVEVPRSARLIDAGFYARRAWIESTGQDYGQFYDPIEAHRRSQSYVTVRAMALDARINFLYRRHRGCEPSYYIDGERHRPRINFNRWLHFAVKPDEVLGMEIYRAVHAAIPEEFREANSNLCGAVVIWTKRGGRPNIPQVQVTLCEPRHEAGGATIEGSVTDRLTGVRLPATRLSLTTRDSAGRLSLVRTTSDTHGRFRFCQVADTPISLGAAYGSVSGEQGINRTGRSDVAGLQVQLTVTPPGAIAGILRGVRRAGMPTVSLLETGQEIIPEIGGTFSFYDLAPGTYSLRVSAAGSTLLTREVTVTPGDTESVLLDLPSL